MAFFDFLTDGMFDFDGDGKTDCVEMTFGFMMMDELEKEENKRETEYQSLMKDLDARIKDLRTKYDEI